MQDQPPTWSRLLTALLRPRDLTPGEASWAMGEIMRGDASPAQVAGFVVALRAKGISIGELTGIADEMLAHAHTIEVAQPCLDIVGTGGDQAHTVNISTMSALVAAAAGPTVVKHGNRASSSRSGTADCLEQLGIALDLSPKAVGAVAAEAGITFCFAQTFHPSMRHAAAARRDLGIPTVFNVLGPLTNPARPTHSAVGVADPAMAPLVAGVFAARGRDAAVFRGDDGLDELTISTTSHLWWVHGGDVREFTVDPARMGVDPAPIESLRGGDPEHNADVVRRIVDGHTGPVRDAVLLNTGVALAVAGPDAAAVATQETFEHALAAGMTRAANAIDSGAARDTLARWRSASQRAR